MIACSRSFGRRPATRYQEELRNGAVLIAACSRQILPHGQVQPLKETVRPYPQDRPGPNVKLRDPLQAWPQAIVVAGEPGFDPVGISSLFGDGHGRDLVEGQ